MQLGPSAVNCQCPVTSSCHIHSLYPAFVNTHCRYAVYLWQLETHKIKQTTHVKNTDMSQTRVAYLRPLTILYVAHYAQWNESEKRNYKGWEETKESREWNDEVMWTNWRESYKVERHGIKSKWWILDMGRDVDLRKETMTERRRKGRHLRKLVE